MKISLRARGLTAAALVAIAAGPLGQAVSADAAPAPASTVGPLLSVTSTSNSFTPNGDQVGDTVAVYGEADLSAQTVAVSILNAHGQHVRSITTVMFIHDGIDAQGNRITEQRFVATWDGRNATGHMVSPGTYTAHVAAIPSGQGTTLDTKIVVARSAKVSKTKQANLGNHKSAVTFDHPVTHGSIVGGDAYVSPGAFLRMSVLNSSGKVVYDDRSVSHHFAFFVPGLSWGGWLTGGGTAPNGHYVLVATSADGVVTKLPVVLAHA